DSDAGGGEPGGPLARLSRISTPPRRAKRGSLSGGGRCRRHCSPRAPAAFTQRRVRLASRSCGGVRLGAPSGISVVSGGPSGWHGSWCSCVVGVVGVLGWDEA